MSDSVPLPAIEVDDVTRWLERAAAADAVRATLDADGVLLLRGGTPLGVDGLARARDLLGLTAMRPTDDVAPRDDLGAEVLGAPHWPGDREMCPHHEGGSSLVAPSVVLVTALTVAPTGGETVVADTADALERLPESVRAPLSDDGWLSVRTYRPFFGVGWAEAFGTDDPVEVEERVAALGWEAEWTRDGALRTAGRRPAVVEHPRTRRPCWWGQLTFCNQWALDDAERDLLLSSFGADALPFNTSYGSGAALRRDEFDAALAAYAPSSRTVHWQPGDLLVIDNIRTAHGRRPHSGERSMAVAPCETFRIAEADPRDLAAPGGHIH